VWEEMRKRYSENTRIWKTLYVKTEELIIPHLSMMEGIEEECAKFYLCFRKNDTKYVKEEI
jgi:hypothetical protein